jgi:hypothetical protein
MALEEAIDLSQDEQGPETIIWNIYIYIYTYIYFPEIFRVYIHIYTHTRNMSGKYPDILKTSRTGHVSLTKLAASQRRR